MVYLLYGEEPFLVRQELQRIRAGLGDPEMLSLNTTVLEGAKVGFAELRAACDTVPFLAEARLVLVEGLLARFEPSPRGASRPSERAARTRQRQEGEWDGFPAYAAQMPGTTHLVLLDGKLSGRNRLLAALSREAQVVQCSPLKGPALEEWVRARAAAVDARLTQTGLRALLQAVGDDLWGLNNELEKLSVYAGDRPIDADDVAALVPSAREATIFNLVDTVATRQMTQAHQHLQSLLADGISPQYILVMLAREFRLLLLAKSLLGHGVRGADLGQRLEIRQDWQLRRTTERAGSYTSGALVAALERTLEADVAMKTGRQAPDLALTLLITELCRSSQGGQAVTRTPYQS